MPTPAKGWAFVELVGLARFELTTFRPPDGRANQAAPQPDEGHIEATGQAVQVVMARKFSPA